MALDDESSWDGILATIFVMRVTMHTTTQYTAAQLVFGLDSILNTRHKTNWQLIKKYKQDLIYKGNQQENCNKNSTCTTNGAKFYLKMCGNAYSSKMYIWVPIQSQLSEMMALLGHVKVM